MPVVNSLPLVCIQAFFLGRPYWRCYYANTDAIIYVVDSADRERIGIAKNELMSMLEARDKSIECASYLGLMILQEEELKSSILMVFANKQV